MHAPVCTADPGTHASKHHVTRPASCGNASVARLSKFRPSPKGQAGQEPRTDPVRISGGIIFHCINPWSEVSRQTSRQGWKNIYDDAGCIVALCKRSCLCTCHVSCPNLAHTFSAPLPKVPAPSLHTRPTQQLVSKGGTALDLTLALPHATSAPEGRSG